MAQARFIHKDIVTSKGFTSLCSEYPEAGLLFVLIFPFLDDWGRCPGEIEWIKGNICLYIKNIYTDEKIEKYLKEISLKTDIVRWFDSNSKRWYIQALNWFEYQKISINKRTPSKYPEITEEAIKSLQKDYAEYIQKKEKYSKIKESSYQFFNRIEAVKLTYFFIENLKKILPNKTFKLNLKWVEIMDKLMKNDQKSSETIKKAILWFSNDKFWKFNVLSPQKLQKHFIRFEAQLGTSKAPTIYNGENIENFN